jgi:DNA replication terminus site-binding protein
MQYDLIQRLSYVVNQLEQRLSAFAKELTNLEVRQATVFELPPALKGAELQPIESIQVRKIQGQEAINAAIRHYTRLFMQQQSDTVSTRSATRLPGVIFLSGSQAQLQSIQQQIVDINHCKQALENLITNESGLSSEARFPFVHQHFPGLITLNAYRKIHLVPSPTSVNFGWANKHFIKHTTKAEVLIKLDKSLNSGRTKAPWTRSQWLQLLQAEQKTIQALPDEVILKYKRPVKVQPIMRLWYAASRRQQPLACPSPLLITCAKNQQLPSIGQLNNYCLQSITHRHRPSALPLRLVIPRLYLWQQE